MEGTIKHPRTHNLCRRVERALGFLKYSCADDKQGVGGFYSTRTLGHKVSRGNFQDGRNDVHFFCCCYLRSLYVYTPRVEFWWKLCSCSAAKYDWVGLLGRKRTKALWTSEGVVLRNGCKVLQNSIKFSFVEEEKSFYFWNRGYLMKVLIGFRPKKGITKFFFSLKWLF